MTTNQIKKTVKAITGFDYVSVRKGTGSMRGLTTIFTSFNDKCSLKPFESELRNLFDIEFFGYYDMSIKV